MYKMDRFKRKKAYLKDILPFAKIIRNPPIVLNKDGSMQTTFQYRGPDLESAIQEQLSIIVQQLNAAIQGLDTGFVIYMEAQRTQSTSYKEGRYFPDPLTRQMDRERKQFFSNGNHYESNYYFTLYWMPPNDNEGRLKEMVVEGKKKKEIDAQEYIKLFTEKIDKLIGVFQYLRIPVKLMERDALLTYLHSTVSAAPRPVKMPDIPMMVDQYLYDSPLYGGVEPRLGNKHIRVVTPITYLDHTVFGMFDRLNQLDFSYRWVTRFFCLSKEDAIREIGDKKSGWNSKTKSPLAYLGDALLNRDSSANLNQNALKKYNTTEVALADVESDAMGFGYYSTLIVITDEDAEQADAKAKYVEQIFVNMGLKAKIEDLNAIDAWLGSIPGNIGRFIRRPLISTGNLIHMAPISDIWVGEAENKLFNGPPLLYTQTTGNTPFRLSLHVGDVGHTLIAGPTGAGKSVLLNILAASFRKYKNSRVIVFDKGASSMVLTAGVGGEFFDLGNEKERLSFQPLAHIHNEKERQWVLDWLCDFLNDSKLTITPEKKDLLWDALNTVATYQDVTDRRMTALSNAVQSTELKIALKPLTLDGAYGHIFDSDRDTLQISSWQSFEMGRLMQTPTIIKPTLMYIFHKIEQELNNTPTPTIIILDECWAYFDNAQFAQKIKEWLKELRKYHASVVFATQSVTDIVESPIFTTILESCVSQIFLPYDKALEETAKEQYLKFGLNQRQIEIIAGAIKKRQYYYVSPLGSRLFELALEHCPLALAYVAVNKTDTQYAAELLKKYDKPDFNAHWQRYKKVKEGVRS